MTRAAMIVQHMMNNDAYSQWLGIEVQKVEPGSALLSMTVREEMTNGFGIAHGSICFALSDSALAFAANGHGRMAVSIDTSIRHLAPAGVGDRLTALAVEKHLGNKTASYEVEIHNQTNKARQPFHRYSVSQISRMGSRFLDQPKKIFRQH